MYQRTRGECIKNPRRMYQKSEENVSENDQMISGSENWNAAFLIRVEERKERKGSGSESTRSQDSPADSSSSPFSFITVSVGSAISCTRHFLPS